MIPSHTKINFTYKIFISHIELKHFMSEIASEFFVWFATVVYCLPLWTQG